MAANVIACRCASYRPFEEIAFAHLGEVGLRHVEIVVPPPDAVDGVEAELNRYGLRVSSMHGECDVDRADIADQIAVQMPTLAALGCSILFVSVRAGDVPRETACARLRQAGEVAAEHGVTIVLETHPDLATNGDEALQTMRAVDHPHVRLNFDTANVYFYNQNTDCVEELRKVAAYVAGVHLKDTDGGYRTWHFPALGEGIVDFAAVFGVLDEAGYSGPYTLEIEGIEGEEKTPALVRGRIARSVDYLRALGRA